MLQSFTLKDALISQASGSQLDQSGEVSSQNIHAPAT